MRRLSQPLHELAPRYDAIVVGSGYGGAVHAARLAEAGWRVGVLERGREFVPGDFPTSGASFLRNTQLRGVLGRRGARTALYHFQLERDLNVLVGCGLGGTSLINAGVALRPDPRIWDDPRWPRRLREGLAAELGPAFLRAEAMLEPQVVPQPNGDAEPSALPRLRTLQHAARALGAPYARAPVTIAFEERVSAAGVAMRACTLCGDCIVGCNVGAKGTLTTSYLARAHAHGAQLFTEIEVRHLRREAEGWRVYFDWPSLGREGFGAPLGSVYAPVVVLAAGALGSPAILMRSAQKGLPLSKHLGRRFSSNGCVLGYSTDLPERVDSVATPSARAPTLKGGPVIGGVIDLRAGRPLAEGVVIQDSAIPSVMVALLGGAIGARWPTGVPAGERLSHTQQYAVTSWDAGDGELHLENDELRLRWPGMGRASGVERVHALLARATAAMGGRYVADPVWRWHPNRAPTTPHPLGGCPMGDDAACGAVDDLGRVFASDAGAQVHPGLIVSDGSILPGPLGSNPLLTITALAERSAERMKERSTLPAARMEGSAPASARDESVPRASRHVPLEEPARGDPPAIAFRFTERMSGRLRRRSDGQEAPFEFVATILWPDLDAILANPALIVPTVGTVTMGSLVPGSLMIEEGRFQLMAPDPLGGAHLRMSHHMRLRAEDGQRYVLQGHKRLGNSGHASLWHDATALYVTIDHESDGGTRRVATGWLGVQPLDLFRQVASMRATRASGRTQHVRDSARFIRWFVGEVLGLYGLRGALRPWYFSTSLAWERSEE